MEKGRFSIGKSNGLEATESRLYFSFVLASLCLSFSKFKTGTFV